MPLRVGIESVYQSKLAWSNNTFIDGTKSTMPKNIRDYVAKNRIRLAAAISQGITHIMLSIETGWTNVGPERLIDHERCRVSSPDHFRMAQLVLCHLFPGRGFQLPQFVLLDIFDPYQAAVLRGNRHLDSG